MDDVTLGDALKLESDWYACAILYHHSIHSSLLKVCRPRYQWIFQCSTPYIVGVGVVVGRQTWQARGRFSGIYMGEPA